MRRFWNKVKKGTRCWMWLGALAGKPPGRGVISILGVQKQASHVAWFLEHGIWPRWPKQLVCHRCDNTRCVRADHLFLGTFTDNRRDAIKKGRQFGLVPKERERVKVLARTGLSQRSIARRVGCSQSTVSRTINGRRHARATVD